MTSNSKNLEDIQFERLNVMNKEKINEKIEDYENNFELKVSLINIDSRFRNLKPKNITEGNPMFLSNNPISTTENSYEVKILYPNHNFNIGDKFIIQNVNKENNIYKDNFYLVNGFRYLVINLENHNYNNINLHNELDNIIDISNYEELEENKRLIGNIPINSILGIKKILTLNDVNIESVILENILSFFNITTNQLNNNFIFIELPFSYSKTNKLDNNEIFSDIYQLKYVFQLSVDEIGGIPLNYINEIIL